MCVTCGVGLPACTLGGACGVQFVDFLKVATMTGGAGLGIALTTFKSNVTQLNSKKDKNEKSKRK